MMSGTLASEAASPEGAELVSWANMRNTRKRRGNVSGGFKEWQLKHLVVLPLASRIDRQAAGGRKSCRRILKRFQGVEDSIQIIAREIARQAGRGE
jgi:hypothetical protein